MSQRYSEQEKNAALNRLDENFGNVPITAQQTGIPTRTLYHWKRQHYRSDFKNTDDPPANLLHKKNPVPPPQTATNLPFNQYAYIYERLINHANHLIDTLMDDPATTHLRISALSRLLDRIIKFAPLVHAHDPAPTINIVYTHPDGSLQDSPPWWDGEGKFSPFWDDR